MPCDFSRYPSNWKEIRANIQKRAGDKCEWCGVQNHAIGARDKSGDWHDENSIENMNSDYGRHLFGRFPKIIKIVCTTAHVYDSSPQNCEESNLAFLCQRCHLNHDREHHMKNAAATRAAKRAARFAAAGQGVLINAK